MHIPMEDLLLALYADYPADSCGTATLAQWATLKAMHASRHAFNLQVVNLNYFKKRECYLSHYFKKRANLNIQQPHVKHA